MDYVNACKCLSVATRLTRIVYYTTHLNISDTQFKCSRGYSCNIVHLKIVHTQSSITAFKLQF